MYRTFLGCATVLLGAAALAGATEPQLPMGAAPAAVATPHFPSRVHALVWRNWQVVEPRKMAEVLGTSVENVAALAASMGLPPAAAIPPQMKTRGYISILRRNWHLLPYEQLLTLVEMSPEQLAYALREDDFLWIKLGSLKPRCERLRYVPPDAAARRRSAEIKRSVEECFGREMGAAGEPRFDFVRRLSEPCPSVAEHKPAACSPALRFIYSYFAVYGDPLLRPELDPYPDGLLQRLAGVGVNGVWLHVVLRNMAPGGKDFPEFGAGHEQRLENLRRLVARAKRHGILVYLYMNEPRAMPLDFFAGRRQMAGVREGEHQALCTSQPAVRQWMTAALAYVFQQVPGLGGVFTITASENLTNCASHGGWKQCPRCQTRSDAEIIAEVNAAIEAGVHRGNPRAKVIVWDWGWRGHGLAPETIAALPKSTWLMSVSEWAVPIERGGVRSAIGEYALSVVGPGPRATRHWELARQAGLKTVAKVQFNNSWELSALPYLPVMDLVAENCRNLSQAGVDGMMLSWSLGGYPSPNLEIAERFQGRPVPRVDEVLDAVAGERFGPHGAALARKAWTAFSRALGEYPYDGSVLYQCPVQMGPANLLYPVRTGYNATMVGIPYDDLRGWRGPYPADTLAAQFQKVAEGWLPGLAALRLAVERSPAGKRAENEAEWRLARAAYLHFQSVANQVRFIQARDALADQAQRLPDAERRFWFGQLRRIAGAEKALARELFTLARLDSRLGFEASNHYFYLPLDLVEKTINCDWIQKETQ
ncbi:MAG: hypothetical protein ABSF26_08245 [Thermoguttaceae bacterium]|jgi:hypothetical protein